MEMKHGMLMLLSVLFLSSCGVKIEPVEQSYSLKVEGVTSVLYEELQPQYTAGTEVEVKVSMLCDADVYVYLNEERINQEYNSNHDSIYWSYHFTMPAKDSVLRLDIFTVEYDYLVNLIPALKETINQKTFTSITLSESYIGTPPGSLITHSKSVDETDLKQAKIMFSSPLCKQDPSHIEGGKALTYAFSFEEETFYFHFSNDEIIIQNETYQYINDFYYLSNPESVYYSIDTMNTSFDVFDCSTNEKVNIIQNLANIYFQAWSGSMDDNEPMYRIETIMTPIYVYDIDRIRIKDTFYKVISETNFYELFQIELVNEQ
jgi:hypothetical protein